MEGIIKIVMGRLYNCPISNREAMYIKMFCGTDIIEIDRIKKSIEDKGNNFLNKIYTTNEITYCESRKNAKYQHYAARFAAKEAIFKAISETLDDKFDITWTDVEILNDKLGKPKVHFVNENFANKYNIDVSISHCKEYAVAIAIVII